MLTVPMQAETVKSMKPLRKKLQKCRDPDRADLVALQQARREQAMNKPKPAEAKDGGHVMTELVMKNRRKKMAAVERISVGRSQNCAARMSSIVKNLTSRFSSSVVRNSGGLSVLRRDEICCLATPLVLSRSSCSVAGEKDQRRYWLDCRYRSSSVAILPRQPRRNGLCGDARAVMSW